MSKDPLDALGAVAREQDESSQSGRWEALARGELSPEEVSELERRAETDPATAELLELYRPLDAEARSRIAERLVPTVVTQGSVQSVIPIWKRVPWVVVPVAAAALVMLWLMQPTKLSPLPGYSATAEGGQSTVRSTLSDAGFVVLKPDSTLTLVLRPATEVKGPVTARFYAKQGDRLDVLALEAEAAAAGALRVKRTAAEIFAQRRGRWTLIAVVGRPEALGIGVESKAKGETSSGPGWQRVSVEVMLSDPE